MTWPLANVAAVRGLALRGVVAGASLLLLAAGAARAGEPSVRAPGDAASASQNARQWLRRIQESSYRRSFTGTFVVSSGGTISSARIIHYCDGRSQIERVDALDGQMRRMFRRDDLVHTLWPLSRQAVVEQRELPRDFPGLPGHGDAASAPAYEALAEGSDRVAGHEAQVLLLKSRDNLRFSQRLWAEKATGLLLRADMLSPRGEVIESSAFSELVLDVRVKPASLVQEMNQLQGYQVMRPVTVRTDLEQEGWVAKEAVPGFVAMRCIKRPSVPAAAPGAASGVPQPAQSLLQAIYSDGLTHVSVFIEPDESPAARAEGLSTLGATSSLSVKRGPWWITVVGDVPPPTLRRFAESIERRRP